MPSRSIPFVNGEFYHIFNRGVAKMQIYTNSYDYYRFTKSIIYYQRMGPKPRFSLFSGKNTLSNLEGEKIVNITCYCLMPNHFHFLLQQIKDNGITEFMGKLSNSYTKYFNTKNKRVGPLLQGEFKSVHVETNEQLIHVSRYIHLNPLVGYKTKNLEIYQWSSYPEYIGIVNTSICEKTIILEQFKSPEAYKQFVLDHEEYARKLEYIKHLLLDYDD